MRPLRALLAQLSQSDRELLADLWGAPSPAPEVLAARMLDPQAAARWLERLSAGGRELLLFLAERRPPQAPVGEIARLYGDLDPDLRDHVSPRSTLEALGGPRNPVEELFRLGWLYREFLTPREAPRGDYVFLPNDLADLLPELLGSMVQEVLTAPPPEEVWPADPNLIPDLTILLAFLYRRPVTPTRRGGWPKGALLPLARRLYTLEEEGALGRPGHRIEFLTALARTARLIRWTPEGAWGVDRGRVRRWLRARPRRRAQLLLTAWLRTGGWNEVALALDPRRRQEIQVREGWRRPVLELLGELEEGRWIDLEAFLKRARWKLGPFLAPKGEGEERGWAGREGAVVRFLLTRSLRWFGAVDVGVNAQGTPVAFRLTPLGAALTGRRPWPEPTPEPLALRPGLELWVPRRAAPYDLFMAERLGELLMRDQEGSRYRLTAAGVRRLLEQGATLEGLLRYLRRATQTEVPAEVREALTAWAREGRRLRIRPALYLEAPSAEALDRLLAEGTVRLLHRPTPEAGLLPAQDLEDLVRRLQEEGWPVEVVGEGAVLDEETLFRFLLAFALLSRLYEGLGFQPPWPRERWQRWLLRLSPERRARLEEEAQRLASIFQTFGEQP